MARHVIDTIEVPFETTLYGGGVGKSPGYLGVGYDDRGRAIFGEVLEVVDRRGDRSHDEFTSRCYLLDTNLDLEAMSQRGLALSNGDPTTGVGRVVVPAEEVSRALGTLDAPPAVLTEGDTAYVTHGLHGFRAKGKVLDRDAETGSLRVWDPSAHIEQDGRDIALPEHQWYTPGGDVDLERIDRYTDGDIRGLEVGSLQEWVEARGAEPVQAQQMQNSLQASELEDPYDDTPEGWESLTDEAMDEMARATSTQYPVVDEVHQVRLDHDGTSFATTGELGLGHLEDGSLVVGVVDGLSGAGDQHFAAGTQPAQLEADESDVLRDTLAGDDGWGAATIETGSEDGRTYTAQVSQADLVAAAEAFSNGSSPTAERFRGVMKRTRQEARENSSRVDEYDRQARSAEQVHRDLFPEDFDPPVPEAAPQDPRVAALRHDLGRLQHAVDQWNPHNPAMMERAERLAEPMKWQEGMIDHIDDIHDQGVEIRTVMDPHVFDDMNNQMGQMLDFAGVPQNERSKPRSPSPEHTARVASVQQQASELTTTTSEGLEAGV